jgi:hypothetical protein
MIAMGKPPAPSDYAILLCPLSRADGNGYLAVVPDPGLSGERRHAGTAIARSLSVTL